MPEFYVGDRVEVNRNRRRIVDAVVKAITIDDKGRRRLQVDFGHEQTALIHEWQVVKA